MRPRKLPLSAVLFSLTLLAPAAGAQGPAPCAPGCPMVTETVYREVTRKVCKWVPDVKKTTKWVYDCKCEDFCAPRFCPPKHGHGCDCDECRECGRLAVKHVLIKKQVVEECPTMKCVVECVTERVPCVVCRPVGPMPCASGTMPLSAPPPSSGVAPMSYQAPAQPASVRVGGLAR